VINYASRRAAAETVAKEAGDLGAGASGPADVADDGAVTAMAGRVRSEFGRLDTLVNNAGTTIKTAPADLDGLDMAGWDRVFAVNVRGGIWNGADFTQPPVQLTVQHSAVTRNSLTGSHGVTVHGGGLFSALPATITVRASVIAANVPDQCADC